MDDDNRSVTPTIRTLAKSLDLAISTVSMALKGHRRISRETCARVQAAAAKMGYTPDPRLANLMAYMKKKRIDKPQASLAYVAAHPADVHLEHHPVFHNYYLGAKQRALELGYSLESFNLVTERLSGRRLMSILRSRGVDGVVISPFYRSRETIDFDFSGVSAITFGYSLDIEGINRVTIDQYLGVLRSLEAVARHGYRRIGLVTAQPANQRMQYRWGAALAAFRAMHPEQSEVPQLESNEREAFLKWYDRYKPDALLCHGVRWTPFLHERGLVCGRDYGFATLEQESVATHASLLGEPALAKQLAKAAGLNQCSRYVGGLAVELLAKDLALNLKGLSQHPKVTLIEGAWIDGDTLRTQR